jgi:phenylacetate-CoA ligase
MKEFLFYLRYLITRPYALKAYKEFMSNQNLTMEQVEELKLDKLRKLFVHSKANSPYYAKVFASISVNDIKTVSDWDKLPVLTKEDIRKYHNEIKTTNISKNRFREVTTGGSTGQPLKVFHDKLSPLDALGWRVFSWWRVKPYSNIGFIYRKILVGWRAKLNAFLWFPTRRFFLDASKITPTGMDEFVRQIKKIKPKIINGYVGGVVEFCKYCVDKGIELPAIDAIWVTAAPLSEPQRTLIERVFKCPVYDQYGCSEIYWIAAECNKQKGLHVFSDFRHLEITNESFCEVERGQYGNVVITDLDNFAFPMIRYVNGDRGRYLSEPQCSCGLPFPLIDKIKGRVSECLITPEGGSIAGEYLTTIFDDVPHIVTQFQILQLKDYSVILKCVLTSKDIGHNICETKRKLIKTLIGENIKVELEFLDEIRHDGGKTRYIKSELFKKI